MPAKKKNWNPYAGIQAQANESGHPLAMITVLKSMLKNWDMIHDPYPYFMGSMAKENPKYHSRDHVAQAAQFKNMWLADPRVKNLVRGLFNGG